MYKKMHTANVCGTYGRAVLKGIAERLLFSNLGFAVELASGFIYASQQLSGAASLCENAYFFDCLLVLFFFRVWYVIMTEHEIFLKC